MEKVQKENDGGLTRADKLIEIERFCYGRKCADCPLYAYNCSQRDVWPNELIDNAYTAIHYHFDDTTEPSQEAKADAGKAQISLVPMEIVWAIAWIRMYGNRKYGDPDNWKTVGPQRYRDALMRHLLHYISDPESVDEESGYPHLWHAACNMAFLMHFDYGPMAYFDWNEELWEKVKKGEIG